MNSIKNTDGKWYFEKIRDYHALLENEYCKIFIFDRDDDDISNEFGNKEFLYHGNNVYSMLLPVPEHRKIRQILALSIIIWTRIYLEKIIMVEDYIW